jgi:hypothetical protein
MILRMEPATNTRGTLTAAGEAPCDKRGERK